MSRLRGGRELACISAARARVAALGLDRVMTLCELDLNLPMTFATGEEGFCSRMQRLLLVQSPTRRSDRGPFMDIRSLRLRNSMKRCCNLPVCMLSIGRISNLRSAAGGCRATEGEAWTSRRARTTGGQSLLRTATAISRDFDRAVAAGRAIENNVCN
jgi:hypothetical protein